MIAYRDEWTRLADYVSDARSNVAASLCKGAWATEAEGRKLVGRFNALNDILEEMNKLSGSGGELGKDL